jgi:predicted ATPase
MRIDSLGITGYRSLYDVVVRPEDLTVITGPNNSGKTNLVESIEFLAETYRHGLEVAISRKGGIENIIHRRMARTRRNLAFSVSAVISPSDFKQAGFYVGDFDANIYITHRFGLVPSSQRIDAEFQITRENAEMRRTPQSAPFFELERENEEVRVDIHKDRIHRIRGLSNLMPSDPDFYTHFPARMRPTDLAFTRTFSPVETVYAEAIGRIRLYQLVPLEARKPGVPTPNAEISAHGENLPALVWYLRKNDSDEWARVIDAMKRVIPELTDVRTEFTTDRQLALQFVERGVRRPWSAEDVSDGTIQSLGMYSAIFDPRASLIMIEEPENSLHPWIIRNFVDICRAADRQILLTTHSPILLSYLKPNEICVAWKREGQTQISRLLELDPDVEEMWTSGDTTLAEVIDSGLIVQSVPGAEH